MANAANWAWQDEHLTWHAYAPEVSTALEAAFADASCDEVSLWLQGGSKSLPSHSIYLQTMEQVNGRSKFARPVRRDASPHPVGANGAWCFKDRGQWTPFDLNASAQVSAAKAFARSGTLIYATHGGRVWPYWVDVNRSTQTNQLSSVERPLRFDATTPPSGVRDPSTVYQPSAKHAPPSAVAARGAGQAIPAGSVFSAGGSHGGGHGGGSSSVSSGGGGGGGGGGASDTTFQLRFHAASTASHDLAALTKWVVLPAGSWAAGATDPIMMSDLGEDDEVVVRLPCQTGATCCTFNVSTLEQAFASSNACPSCGTKYELPGPQPTGTMDSMVDDDSDCDGHPDVGSIVIEYVFHDGTQAPQHPRPGQRYHGTSRQAHLPNDDVGRQCVHLLRAAFLQGALFRIGDSATTGRKDTVVWAIHQKTSPTGGPTRHGWPDDGYLQRLQSECAAAGVKEALASLT